MRSPFDCPRTAFAVVAALAILVPGLLQAGTLGWDTFADDASGSMMSFAAAGVPLAIGATLLSAFGHMTAMTTGLMAGGASLFGAANADLAQGVIGGGAGGGLITDLALPVAAQASLLSYLW